MPQPGLWWWHLILTTPGSWLPGDPRGFRSRGHRINSSGDYQNPPPRGEHAGLYHPHHTRSKKPVIIPELWRSEIAAFLLQKLKTLEVQTLARAIGAQHAHILIEDSVDKDVVRRLAGKLKQHSSHAVNDAFPGRFWASDLKAVRIRDQKHQRNVFHDILDHVNEGRTSGIPRSRAGVNISGNGNP
jgi:REP element-mobilizing transposase RayT